MTKTPIRGGTPPTVIVSQFAKPPGPALDCLQARCLIDNDIPLLIVNCDQIIEDFNWDIFNAYCIHHDVDGAVGVFQSASPKNSYVRVNDNNEVIETKEKVVISSLATNGLHFWRRGRYFCSSVDRMQSNGDSLNGEYYVAPSYNYMLQAGMKVMPFHFNLHFPIGIPDDYEYYRRIRGL